MGVFRARSGARTSFSRCCLDRRCGAGVGGQALNMFRASGGFGGSLLCSPSCCPPPCPPPSPMQCLPLPLPAACGAGRQQTTCARTPYSPCLPPCLLLLRPLPLYSPSPRPSPPFPPHFPPPPSPLQGLPFPLPAACGAGGRRGAKCELLAHARQAGAESA